MLDYQQFKSLCDTVGKQMTEEIWHDELLSKVESTYHMPNSDKLKPAITLDGLKRFFINEIERARNNEERMFKWLESLGYDDQL